VDGNRTRHRGVATIARFEGGGAHQEPRHLQPPAYPGGRERTQRGRTTLAGMKKILLLVILVTLGVVAAKKLRVD
jgi:hypothetical protein